MVRWILALALLSAPCGIAQAQTAGPPTMQTYTYTVRTAATAPTGAITVLGVTWTCNGNACVANGPWQRPAMTGCIALARRLGVITYLGREGAAFDAAQLAQCNASGARQTSTQPSHAANAIVTPILQVVGGETYQAGAAPARHGVRTARLEVVGAAAGASAIVIKTSRLSVDGQ